MNERICSDLVSFNCTTAFSTGLPDASVTSPWTERVFASSFERLSWASSPQLRTAAIKHTDAARLWGRLVTCAPIGNRRKLRGLPTRAQDAILPHNQTDP